ncbi:MAG TPA: hypothetical protein VFO54_00115, partial [Chryseosolibacter sp.]|nr:hypothetical protein [Chryseosolibacter sp.]
MKRNKIIIFQKLGSFLAVSVAFFLATLPAYSQDEPDSVAEQAAPRPIRDTFESTWLIDNQSV